MAGMKTLLKFMLISGLFFSNAHAFGRFDPMTLAWRLDRDKAMGFYACKRTHNQRRGQEILIYQTPSYFKILIDGTDFGSLAKIPYKAKQFKGEFIDLQVRRYDIFYPRAMKLVIKNGSGLFYSYRDNGLAGMIGDLDSELIKERFRSCKQYSLPQDFTWVDYFSVLERK